MHEVNQAKQQASHKGGEDDSSGRMKEGSVRSNLRLERYKREQKGLQDATKTLCDVWCTDRGNYKRPSCKTTEDALG